MGHPKTICNRFHHIPAHCSCGCTMPSPHPLDSGQDYQSWLATALYITQRSPAALPYTSQRRSLSHMLIATAAGGVVPEISHPTEAVTHCVTPKSTTCTNMRSPLTAASVAEIQQQIVLCSWSNKHPNFTGPQTWLWGLRALLWVASSQWVQQERSARRCAHPPAEPIAAAALS
jgi:hypothetical protein